MRKNGVVTFSVRAFGARWGVSSAVLLLALGLFVRSVHAERGPELSVPEPTFNFGSVPQGHKVEHEFVIKNTGDSDLLIQKIAPSCGCTAAAMSAEAVKPGAVEKIKVAFNTAGFFGEKTKSVAVLTNARNQPEVTLTVQGTIIREVTTTPDFVQFGEVSADTSLPLRTKDFVVNIKQGSTREVVNVRSLSKHLEVTPKGAQGDGKAYSVTLLPDAPRGQFRERVLIEFKDAEHTAVNVPIIASVVGDIRLIPSTISFGILSEGQPMERRVRFENSSKQGVAIESVTSTHPAITTSVLPVEAGKRGVIVVSLDPKKVTGDLRTSLQVRTTHPEEQVLSLNVFAVQAPK